MKTSLTKKNPTAPYLAVLALASHASALSQDRIIFESNRDGSGEIYVMDPDGQNLVRITSNDLKDQYASYSPDGAQIVFTSAGANEPDQLFVMDANGDNSVQVTTRAMDGGQDPLFIFGSTGSFSSDGEKIVFICGMYKPLIEPGEQRTFFDEICTIKPDGTNLVRLTQYPTPIPQFYGYSRPQFSPDGRKIITTCVYPFGADQVAEEVCTLDADGTNQVRLTSPPRKRTTVWGNASASYSPAGDKVVFTSYRDGNWEIYSMNSDGTGQTRLTNTEAPEFVPSYSPDGSRIVFQSLRDGNSEIYTINADGSDSVRLTNNDAYDGSAAWWGTPDGRPAAPTGLVALSVAGSEIMLGWNDNASNETGFSVERCMGRKCTNFAEIGTVVHSDSGTATFTDSGLANATLYQYRVRAVNGTTYSGFSNVLAVKTLRR